MIVGINAPKKGKREKIEDIFFLKEQHCSINIVFGCVIYD